MEVIDTDNVCWNLTNACNKGCIYCFRELFEAPLSLDECYIVADRLEEMGIKRITFSGGEPFLFKDILPLINYVKEKGIEINVITNGSLLNKDNIAIYLKDISKIKFSIDSPNEYYNEKVGRGKNYYQHIKELIPYIRDMYKDIKIGINSVVINDPLKEYKELDDMYGAIYEDLDKYNIDKWKIIRFYALRGYAKERKEELNVNDSDFEQIKEIYSLDKENFDVVVRDHSDMDELYVVSPQGILKKSLYGEEEEICSLVNERRCKHV